MNTSAEPDFVDSAKQPEKRGIEFIEDADRHGRAKDLFAVWAAPNVSVLNFTIGATMTLLGLEIWQSVLVVLASNLLWIYPGIVAASGPAAGTSGSVIQRAFYGIRGNKIVIAFYGWFISGVFLALNWVASSFMGAELLSRMGLGNKTLGLVLVTVLVSLITVLVAVFGHGLILRAYTAVTLLLLVIFLAVTGFVLPQIDWSFAQSEPLRGVALWSAITIGFAIMASTPLSYSNSADMARYLPRDTSPFRVAAATAFGGAIPCFVFTMVGVLLATAVPPESMDLGIEYALLDMLPGWLGPVFVIGVVLNTIALNGMTTYTASMAFQSIGIPIRRIPSAIVIGVLGTFFTLYLVMSTSLLDAVNIMLQLLILISAPTIAVYATDIILRRNRYDGPALFDETPSGKFWFHRGFSLAGLAAVVLAALAGSLFITTDIYSGPIAVAMGYVDLSVPVCLLIGSLLYATFASGIVRRQVTESA